MDFKGARYHRHGVVKDGNILYYRCKNKVRKKEFNYQSCEGLVKFRVLQLNNKFMLDEEMKGYRAHDNL